MSDIKSGVQLATALQLYAQQNDSSFMGPIRDMDRERNINKLLTSAGLRLGSFDSLFPVLYSFHGIDVTDAISQAEIAKDITTEEANYAKTALYSAIDKIGTTYPVLTADKWTEIEKKLQAIVEIITEASSADMLSVAATTNLRKSFEEMRKEFNKAMLVSYVAKDSKQQPSIKVISNSFAGFRDTINSRIKSELWELLAKAGPPAYSKLSDPNYLTTRILNWGHTKTGDSIMSGKLMASLISLKNLNPSNDALKIIALDFIKETGQVNTEIKLHRGKLTRGDKTVLSLVISSNYLQKVISQYVPYNQVVLGKMEKAWNLADAIKRNPRLKKMLGVKNIEELALLLLNMKSSPNSFDNIVDLLASTMQGTKTKPIAADKIIGKFSEKIKVASKKIKLQLKPGTGANPGNLPQLRTTQGRFTSLASLQTLLNLALAQQIQRNMGTGTSKNILNYRTGRLAESAEVTSMSQSRAGMISAYYTYMKYPYQTFEPGYAQGTPASRDPKLLISKSIREILSTQVKNRLRAVLA